MGSRMCLIKVLEVTQKPFSTEYKRPGPRHVKPLANILVWKTVDYYLQMVLLQTDVEYWCEVFSRSNKRLSQTYREEKGLAAFNWKLMR